MATQLKIDAARAALSSVENGMRLGIGTGSTANEFIRLLGHQVKEGLDIIGVPTSVATAKLCEEYAIPLTTLDATPVLDLTIDGADEIDKAMNLIKGGGGALLREKIVACASARMIVISDDSKLVAQLGAYPLPVEVNSFGLKATLNGLANVVSDWSQPVSMSVRLLDGDPFVTDGGHLIVDILCGHIDDANSLSDRLLEVPGVVQHGLFLNIATEAFVAGNSGVSHLTSN